MHVFFVSSFTEELTTFEVPTLSRTPEIVSHSKLADLLIFYVTVLSCTAKYVDRSNVA